MGFKPTISELDLLVLYRLSYVASTEADQGNLGSQFAVYIEIIQVYSTGSTCDIEILFKLIVKVLAT